ncbi:hypothetical protein KAI46_15030 [bacterium]|nr:hypothetical protein [bacterium]
MKENMMKKSAAVFLVTMLFVSRLMGGTAPVTKDDRIPIVAYWEGMLDQISADAYKLMAEGGVTHGILARSWKGSLTDVDAALDAAHKAGIKLIPTCRELKNTPETAVAHLKSHPALAGYFVADEPSASNFLALAKMISRIRSVDTNHPCYINLFPNHASSKQLGTATYQKHVDKFLAKVPVEFLSFDNYPIINYSVRSGWYENLEIVSKAAKAKGIPFWAVALSSTHYDYTPATLPQLRLQMHANLAYGAQALQYFPYWQPNVNHFYCPINSDGTKGPLYESVKTLNGEIQAIASVFKNSSVLRVGHTGKKAQWWNAGQHGTNFPHQKEGPVPNGTTRYKPASPVASFIAQGQHGAIVSELVNGKNRYLVVVNKDYAHVMVLRITFDRTKNISVIGKDGSAAALEKNVFMKLVDPGDIVIFTWSE